MIWKTADRFALSMFCIACFVLIMIVQGIHAQESVVPFYKGGTYTSGIPAPEEVIGFPLCERPVKYEEAVLYIKTLAEKSPRVRLFKAGESHEKRALYYLLISSEENIAQLDAIRENLSKLADPRKISSKNEAQEIINTNPAVAWMMYSIHGDEFSGTDASLQLAYQLAAGTDPGTEKIRREMVVGIDPMENPDGRERYSAQMQQWAGLVTGTDGQSIQHTGAWPWGRTNHYLFDLNRDWFILAHPESRARVKAQLQWSPQLVVDAHEMGSYDTYLFNPPREPINPNIHQSIKKWWKVFAADQAKAFDNYGWSYYTREWSDEWFPGYGNAWSYYIGAVGILYEQAGTDGSPVKRPEGKVLSFRESVHHQFISSMANLSTAAENRSSMLSDYYKMKKEAISPGKKAAVKAYLIDPGMNPTRAQNLIERLLMQGIEVEKAQEEFRMKNLRSFWESKPAAKTLPEGTYIIRLSQPLRPLINAILEFDPRMTTEFLKSEREHLEKGKGTRMYEASAWSMSLAYNVDIYQSKETPSVKTTKIEQLTVIIGEVINPEPAYGFIIDYQDDRSVDALLKLFEPGYKVRAAKKPFRIEERSFLRGSLLLRLNENPDTIIEDIGKIARTTHIKVYGVNTALSQEGPDLGGREFQLLTEPRIALLTGSYISSYSFGSLWYMLDYELKCRHSVLNCSNIGNLDLRKYNVLILPSTWGGLETYRKVFGEKELKQLKDWVTNGGTIIGIGSGATFLADSTTSISQVKLRRQALKDLPLYEKAVKLEQDAGKGIIDSLAIWEGIVTTEDKKEDDKKDKQKEKMDEEELSERDKQKRLFMPRGPIMRVDLDEEHWLNFGVGSKVPAIIYTSYAFLSKKPVQTAGRFSEASRLRLSGLMWPEARNRWEKTAYVTREQYGKGQIILFLGEPNFRSYFYGTGRMLINSILLGPGFGTQRVVDL